jgi:hypothetical protein
MENGQIVTKNVDGISRQARGEFFENQIRYILRKSGFQDVQRGLKVYKNLNGLTGKPTPEEFSDIDIIANSKNKREVIICELKNWSIEVSQKVIEDWVQSKLNPIVGFLQTELGPRIAIEAWYIVSKKQQDTDVVEIRKKCKCNIKVYSKLELIDDVLSKIDPLAAKELRPIIL